MKYEKLPKGFKTKWLKALRSGEYKQGRRKLKKEGAKAPVWCCLGVAGDICGVTNFKNEGYFLKGKGIVGINKVPKQLIGNWLQNDLVDSLTYFNDIKKWSFKKIATWIEKTL